MPKLNLNPSTNNYCFHSAPKSTFQGHSQMADVPPGVNSFPKDQRKLHRV